MLNLSQYQMQNEFWNSQKVPLPPPPWWRGSGKGVRAVAPRVQTAPTPGCREGFPCDPCLEPKAQTAAGYAVDTAHGGPAPCPHQGLQDVVLDGLCRS